MIILVLNCGSSSIKYQVIDVRSVSENILLAKGNIDRIGLSQSVVVHRPVGRDKHEINKPIPDHSLGINLILSLIVSPVYGVIDSLNQLNAVGHRVTHGGESFHDSVVINRDVIKKIEECIELAPLHNSANLEGITAVESLIPGISQVAVFDTSFHQTMPMMNYLYGLPYRYYEELHVRKYGFHGTSHKFVAKRGCELVGLDYNKSKVISCHIGNGASITAIVDGQSFDTSMGFTPVDGLLMGTRCGDLDPGALLYIADKERLSIKQSSNLINKESGLLGITDISSDMRDIEVAALVDGNQRAALALSMYYSRVKKYIGSYAATMEGVDLVVFTGGIGENSLIFRENICRGLGFMGIEFDSSRNEQSRGADNVISTDSSKVKIAVVITNEELVIAIDTFKLLKRRSDY